MIFKAEYFANLLWIALYDYMRMYEWLIGVEYDFYHDVMYFLLYLNCEKSYDVVELYRCWRIHICWLIVILSVTAYISSVDDLVSDCIYAKWMVMMWWIVCVNICIVVKSYVHAYMTDGDRFYIQNVRRVWNLTYDVFVASKVTTLRWFGTTCI